MAVRRRDAEAEVEERATMIPVRYKGTPARLQVQIMNIQAKNTSAHVSHAACSITCIAASDAAVLCQDANAFKSPLTGSANGTAALDTLARRLSNFR